MKYANVINDIVDSISFMPNDGFVGVDDTVFAGFTVDGNGDFHAPVKSADDTRIEIANENRSDCETQILSIYPDKLQRSAALGVYPQSYVDTMSDYIARCITEENRVFDLLEAATTVAEIMAVETPTYPKV